MKSSKKVLLYRPYIENVNAAHTTIASGKTTSYTQNTCKIRINDCPDIHFSKLFKAYRRFF